MSNFLRDFRQSIRHREVLLLSAVAAIGIMQTPLQHYIELSRFQHYTLGVGAIAIGFLLQTVISWRASTLWARLSLLTSAIYLGTFAYTCFANPWLDPNFDLQTTYQGEIRPWFAGGFVMAAFVVSFFWANWLNEGYQKQDPRDPKVKEKVRQ